MGIECRQLSHIYHTQQGDVAALEDVSFHVAPREFICIVGPSGCGKTTLLRILAGLVPPSGGSVTFNSGNGRALSNAMVFQEHGLFPWKNVLDNVAFGLEMLNVPKEERHRRAMSFIEQVGLTEFARSYPHTLSVGMRQRVGIIRAFVADPDILLMDEPLGALDAQTKRVLREELLRIWEYHQKMVIYLTHDIEEAALLADRILVMTGRPGRIRDEIPVPFARPRDRGEHRAEIEDIKTRIWKMLEEEVRKCLRIDR